MKKRILVFLLAISIICTLAFTACGGPSIDSIKQKYKDAGFSVTTSSEDSLSKLAGAIEGFFASKKSLGVSEPSIYVNVYKFNKKELAKEYESNQNDSFASIKNEIYVCKVWGYRYGELGIVDIAKWEAQSILDIFNSSF